MKPIYTKRSMHPLTQRLSRLMMAFIGIACASSLYAQNGISQPTRKASLPAPATSARMTAPQQTNTVLKPQTEFHCEDGRSYLFQGDGNSNAATLQSNTSVYQINISGGTITQVHGPLLTGDHTSINNTGYNIKDDFIWGYVRGTNNVVRIKNDWSTTQYAISGLYDSNEPYNAGDIDKNGIMYLFYGASSGSSSVIRRVDLNPGSATYKQKLSSITLTPVNSNRYIIDLGYNPIDGKLYGLDGDDGHLYRINPTNGVVTDLGDANIPANDPFGAVYFDNAGTLYISQNVTGKLYKIPNVANGTHTAVFLRNGPQTRDNDGARCSESPLLLNISGTVFNDANGLVDNTVNGTPVSALAGNTFRANLVGSNGKVIATTTLTNGEYTFSDVTPNASYSVVLTNSAGTVGSNPPATALTGSVVNTGEHIGTNAGNDGKVNGIVAVVLTNDDVDDVNFGVERLPTADAKTASSQANPGGTTRVDVPTLTGSDPEDGTYNGTSKTNTIVIQSLPPVATGVLYYNGVVATVDQIITNYDPAKLEVDPVDGPVSVTFTYSEKDAAGQESPVAKVTIPFIVVPDLTPIIYVLPSTVYNTTPITVVVDVIELLNVPTTGLITVKIPKDPKFTLSFSSATTNISNRNVKNSAWTFSGPTGGFYTLTTNQVIAAGDVLSFGLTGTLTPGATTGTLTFSAIIQKNSGGEIRIDNNNDADRVDYFEKY